MDGMFKPHPNSEMEESAERRNRMVEGHSKSGMCQREREEIRLLLKSIPKDEMSKIGKCKEAGDFFIKLLSKLKMSERMW